MYTSCPVVCPKLFNLTSDDILCWSLFLASNWFPQPAMWCRPSLPYRLHCNNTRLLLPYAHMCPASQNSKMHGHCSLSPSITVLWASQSSSWTPILSRCPLVHEALRLRQGWWGHAYPRQTSWAPMGAKPQSLVPSGFLFHTGRSVPCVLWLWTCQKDMLFPPPPPSQGNLDVATNIVCWTAMAPTQPHNTRNVHNYGNDKLCCTFHVCARTERNY